MVKRNQVDLHRPSRGINKHAEKEILFHEFTLDLRVNLAQSPAIPVQNRGSMEPPVFQQILLN